MMPTPLSAKRTTARKSAGFSRRPKPGTGGGVNYARTATRGPRPVATAQQVERVLALHAAGSSLRATALAVFGDRALYGRVRRLLRSTRRKTERELVVDLEVTTVLARIDADEALSELSRVRAVE
jgi:hypothetical protein